MDLKDTKTLTIIIILVIVCFACVYVWQIKKNTVEGFAEYSVTSGDTVKLANLDNVLVGSGNIALSSTINKLINDKLAQSMYAKQSDLEKVATAFNGTISFVDSIAYKRTGEAPLTPSTKYNTPRQFLEIFNWNNLGNLKNTTLPSSKTLPTLQSNTTYIFHVFASLYCKPTATSAILVCLDDNNNNTTSISDINNNNKTSVMITQNSAGYNWYRLTLDSHFKVTTSNNNPNIVLGYIEDEGDQLIQDEYSCVSIVIYKINKSVSIL